MIPEHISKLIEQAFTDEMNDKYHLVYSDYRDSIDNQATLIHKCMENNSAEALMDCEYEWFSECRREAGSEEVIELTKKLLHSEQYAGLHPYIDEWINDEDNNNIIRWMIEERDRSEPMQEIIDRTSIRARVTQFTNCDSLPPIWDKKNTYEYSDYFKDMTDLLFLNPALLKKALSKSEISTPGRWPDLSYRNGKEAVDYDSFVYELSNQSCYAQLVFMGMLPLDDLYHNDFGVYKGIIVPKGNMCGMFNFWNGCGSVLEMELKRDLLLPFQLPRKTKFDRCVLQVDERDCAGYCINDVYGLIPSAWGKEFKIIYDKQHHQFNHQQSKNKQHGKRKVA